MRNRFYECEVPAYQELSKEKVAVLTVAEPKSGGRVDTGRI